jgi:hypothetical protein
MRLSTQHACILCCNICPLLSLSLLNTDTDKHLLGEKWRNSFLSNLSYIVLLVNSKYKYKSYLKQTGYILKYKSEQGSPGFVESIQCYKPKFHGTKRGSVMPKVQYPPQGGEKHLCFTLFCTMMMSVVSAVAIIYAIVIIYLPAKVVLESTLQGPKMCTTLSKEGNLSGIETCQDWSSCEEWCLSIVST